MSIVSFIFLLLLLGLSFHACNARPFGFTKNNEKDSLVKISVPPKVKEPSLSSKTEVTEKDTMVKKSKVDEDSKANNGKELKDQRVKTTASVQPKPLVSGSWRVPHTKRGEQQPGFNLDYSPPKEHPPVHN